MADIDWANYIEGLVRQLLLLPAQHLHQRVAELAQLRGGENLLELGCGPGNFTWALGRQAVPLQYVGLDSEPVLIERAILESRRNLCAGQLAHFGCADLNQPASQWGLGEAVFDVAVCTNNLYALHAPDRTMNELAARVRPGGRLVVCNPGPQPDLTAILWEHLLLACPGESPYVDAARAVEKTRILAALAPALQPNEAILASQGNHFLDQAGLLACFGPAWTPVQHETIYGQPHQNHLLVLERSTT